jgi:hypothetical protein
MSNPLANQKVLRLRMGVSISEFNNCQYKKKLLKIMIGNTKAMVAKGNVRVMS